MSDQSRQIEDLFHAALEIPDADERKEFLAKAALSDSDLLHEVNLLLEAHHHSNSFIEQNTLLERVKLESPSLVQEGPGSTIGNYKLLQEIGEGGFGVVYMAEQLLPVRRRVALKIIKPGMDTREIVARFEAERQALALMTHPYIAQVLDAGETAAHRPFFVMELVKGVPITEFCDKNKLSTRGRLELFLNICGAIQYAHQKGVIHRDIKPSNILITLHDGTPVPKVIDFGIAKALNQELTEKTLFTAYGQMIGTPQYTSPEQAEMSGLDIDTRSDIYSLGVLLYELLTGQTPIERKELTSANYAQMQKLIREKEATKPSAMVSLLCRESTNLAEARHTEPSRLIHEIKGDLDWIVLKALEKDRTRRYETATGFAQDIQRNLDYEPVSASPPTAAYLLGKFARRHRRLISAAASVFLALLIGAVGMTFLYLRASSDRRDAVSARRTAEVKTQTAEKAQIAEADARRLAQRNADRLRKTLARADLMAGVELLAQDDDRQALPRLARSLRTDPEFLPAAQVLLSALRDRNYDLEPEIVLRHEAPVTSFSLNETGDCLLTYALDGTARLWETRTFTLRQELGKKTPLKSASFTPDGSRLTTLGSNGVVQVWNVQSLQPEGRPVAPEGGALEFKTVAPGGGLVLATRSGAGRLQVWDGLSGRPLTPPLQLNTELEPVDFRLNGDGSRLMGRFGDDWIGYWDVRTGKPLRKPISLQDVGYSIVSLSRNAGCNVLTNATRTAFAFYDLNSDKTFAKLTFNETVVSPPIRNADDSRAIFQFRSVERTPQAPMAHFGAKLTTRVIDLQTGKVTNEFVDENAPRNPVIHAASGRGLLRINDFTVRVRDVKTGAITAEIEFERRLADSNDDADVLIFSPSGDRFAVQFADNSLEVYNSNNGRLQSVCEPESAPHTQIFFSPEGQRLAASTAAGKLRVLDAATGEPLTPGLQHTLFAGRAKFTRDGLHVISSDVSGRFGKINYGSVRVWSVMEGRAIDESLPLPPVRNHPVDISDENRFAVAASSGDILILDIATRKTVRKLSLPGKPFYRASMSPQGNRLVALASGDAFVCDLRAAEPTFQPVATGGVFSAHFSPDGTRLVTASKAAVQVWDSVTGAPVTPPPPNRQKGSANPIQRGCHAIGRGNRGHRVRVGS